MAVARTVDKGVVKDNIGILAKKRLSSEYNILRKLHQGREDNGYVYSISLELFKANISHEYCLQNAIVFHDGISCY